MDININTNPPYLVKKWMDFWGFQGLALPFTNTIYIRSVKYISEALIRHEEEHLKQMKRDGNVRFLIKYNWYWLTVGYCDNPYEVEARKAEKNE